MHDAQWGTLLKVVAGEAVSPLPVGFIVDSPWLPGWCGMSVMDYFASESMWLDANLRAIRKFPDILFLPGFWAEFGMCTEPSAFGAKCTWQEHELPHAAPILAYDASWSSVQRPDPSRDGLPPFVLKRLEHARPAIEQEGHALRFAVARGPMNVASFLVGTTELMMGLKEKPEECHALLTTITGFLEDWLRLQKERFPSIGGILVLDDIVGFVGEEDLAAFCLPYLSRVFTAFDAQVRFLHNDAHGLVCAPHLAGIGVNLFNFSHQHSLADMRARAGKHVALLGNIPPRDGLAAGSSREVRQLVRGALEELPDRAGLVLSAGGGMPPGVSTANIEAFLAEARA